MKHLKVMQTNHSGFSLPQLMISIAVFGVLAAGVAYWLLQSNLSAALEAERARLQEVHRGVELQFTKDFAATILTTGPSANATEPEGSGVRLNMHGIERWPHGSVRTNPADNDELVIRIERDAHIAVPVNIESSGFRAKAVICKADAQPANRICLLNSDPDTQAKFDYFAAALSKFDTFSVSSSIQKDLVKRSGNPTIGSSEMSFDLDGFNNANVVDFSYAPSQLRVVETVRYYITPEHVLMRSVRTRQGQESVQALADNVLRLQVNHDFSRARDFGFYWPANQSPLSSPSALTVTGSQKAPQWKHLSKSFFRVVYGSSFKPRASGLSEEAETEDNNKDEWTRARADGAIRFRPQIFSIIPGAASRQNASQASSAFCPRVSGRPAIGARCKDDCNQMFTNHTAGSPDWVGYRTDAASLGVTTDYCTCAYNPDLEDYDYPYDNPSAQSAIKPWTDSISSGGGAVSLTADQLAYNNRLEACGRMHGCSGVTAKFPAYNYACFNRCLQDDGLFSQVNSDGRPNRWGGLDVVKALTRIRAPNANPPSPYSNNDYMSCRLANSCDGSDIKGSMTSVPANKWKNECDCRAVSVLPNGQQAPADQELEYFGRKNWGTLCNLGWTPGNAAGVNRRCDNTMDAQGNYILRTASNLRGLSESEMTLCACLRDLPTPMQQRYYQNTNGTTSGGANWATDLGGISNQIYDFNPNWNGMDFNFFEENTVGGVDKRTPQQVALTQELSSVYSFTPPSGGADYSMGRYLSTRKKTIPFVNYVDPGNPGVQQQYPVAGSPSLSCNDAFVPMMLTNPFNNNMGCCLSNRPECNNNVTIPPSIRSEYSEYSTYCNAKCVGAISWPQTTLQQNAGTQGNSVIANIRRAITGTPPGGSLPLGCGGTGTSTTPGPGGGGTSGTNF